MILNHAGADGTEAYMKQMHSEVADRILSQYVIGEVEEERNEKPKE